MRRHTDEPAALTVSRCALPRPHVLLLVLHRRYCIGKLRNLRLQGRDVLCARGAPNTMRLELGLLGQKLGVPCFAMSWKRSSPVWIENATSFSVICGGCGRHKCSVGSAQSPNKLSTNRAHAIAKAHAVQARRGRNN